MIQSEKPAAFRDRALACESRDAVAVDDGVAAGGVGGIDAEAADGDGGQHGKGQKRSFHGGHLRFLLSPILAQIGLQIGFDPECVASAVDPLPDRQALYLLYVADGRKLVQSGITFATGAAPI